MLRKAGLALGSLFFLYCVAVQYNDCDWRRWMAVYGAAAALPILPARARCWVSTLLAVGSLVWAVILFPEARSDRYSIDREVPREFLGLSIVVAWSVASAVMSRRRTEAPS